MEYRPVQLAYRLRYSLFLIIEFFLNLVNINNNFFIYFSKAFNYININYIKYLIYRSYLLNIFLY